MSKHPSEKPARLVRQRPGRINVKAVIILVVVVAVLGGGAAVGYKIRKRIIANEALEAAKQAFVAEDWAEARKQYRRYLERYPDDEEALGEYAEANLNIRPLDPKRLGDAISAYRRLLRFRPADDEICAELVRLYLGVGDFEEASYIARQRLAAAPDDVDAKLSLGQALFGAGNHEEAAEALSELVDAHPDQVDAYILLSRIEQQNLSRIEQQPRASDSPGEEEEEEGDYWLNRAIENNPKSAAARAHRAKHYLERVGDVGKAREDLEAADELKPRDPRTLLLLMDQWIRLRAYDRARGELDVLEQLSDEELEQFDIAPETFALFKNTAAARLVMAAEDAEGCVAIADRALGELDDRGRLTFLPVAAQLYLEGGRTGRARECLTEYEEARVARREANIEAGRTELEVLRAELTLAEPEGNPFEAIASLRAIVVTEPGNARAWRLLAEAYEKTGQTRRALDAREKWAARAQVDADALVDLSRRMSTNDPEKARDYAKRAQSLAPDSLEPELVLFEAMVGMVERGARREENPKLEDLGALDARADAHPEEARLLLCQARLAARDEDGRSKAIDLLEKSRGACEDKVLIDGAIADYALAEGELDLALEKAQLVVKALPGEAMPAIRLAEVLAARKEFDGAFGTLEDAIQRLEGNEQEAARLAKVRMLLLHDRRDEGIAMLRTMAENETRTGQLRLMLLAQPEVQSDAEQAQRLVDQIRAIEGEEGLIWPVEQARVWINHDQQEAKASQIEDYLTRVIGAGAAGPGPVVMLGKFYEARERYGEAEEVYRRALDSRQVHVSVLTALAELLGDPARAGRADEALSLLERFPSKSGPLGLLRIQMLLQERELEGLATLLASRIAADPNDASSLNLLAQVVYFRDKGVDIDRAMRLLKEAEVIDPKSLDTPFKIAIALLDKANGIDPDSLDTPFARALILQAEGETDEAVALVKEMIADKGTFDAHLRGAWVYMSAEMFVEAEAEYRHLTTLEDRKADAHQLLGNFYVQRNRMTDAIAAFEAGLEHAPKDVGLRLSLAAALLADGSAASRLRCRTLTDELVAERPEDADVLLLKAGVMMSLEGEAGRREAEDLLERVVQLAPRNVVAHLHLIELRREAGDLAGARELVTRALGSNSSEARLIAARALIEADAGNLDEAKELSRRVLEDAPDNVPALHGALAVAVKQGDWGEVEAFSQRLLKLDPHDAAATVSLANAKIARDDADGALDGLRPFYESGRGRGNVGCHLAMAKAYSMKRDFVAASELMQQAERVAPGTLLVFHARCELLAAQKRWDAIYELAQGVKAGSGAASGFFEIAALAMASSMSEDQWPRAIELCQRAIEADDARVGPHVAMGQIRYLSGDVDGAEKAYRDARARDPFHARALNDLAWILGIEGDKVEEALELAQTGARRHRDDAHLADTLGALLAKDGQIKEARKELERCLQVDRIAPATKVSALRHLADVLVKQDQRDLAARRLREALATDDEQKVLSDADRAEVEAKLKELGGGSAGAGGAGRRLQFPFAGVEGLDAA